MNNTIILSQLSETIAGLTQSETADAESFVRELVVLVAERLESDGRVEVPGVGTFVITDGGVDYAPDEALAEAINAPFSAFEAVELPDDEELPDSGTEPEAEVAEETVAEQAVAEESEQEPEPAVEAQEVAEAAEFEQEALAEEPAPEPPAPVAVEEPEPEPERRRPLTWPWWMIACIVCFIGGYMAGSYTAPVPAVDIQPEPEPEQAATSVEPDTLIVEPVEPASPRQIVTDTVSSNRFLTTIARRHYGHMDFWPYIYEANADKLGDPNKVAAGTVVVVPPADSLKLDPNCVEQLTVAREKGDEIYRRFNSK